MIKPRRSKDRGHTKLSWFDSYHTFSFGDYYEPQHMGFSDLKVINEDRVEPGKGFGTHYKSARESHVDPFDPLKEFTQACREERKVMLKGL